MISGCVGPQDDGYSPSTRLTAEAAEAYHSAQIATFAGTAADMVTAITMTYVEEAIGVARAANRAGLPVVISFTVETDGRLPSGQTLSEAIAHCDWETDAAPAYYMINCAHPTHFEAVLDGEPWRERIRGLRANASTRSHAELDEATELDEGDPTDLGRPLRGPRGRAAAAERARRLLRHRPPPRRGDRRSACRLSNRSASARPRPAGSRTRRSARGRRWSSPRSGSATSSGSGSSRSTARSSSALARSRTVIRYDRLGTGLSDRDAVAGSELETLVALVDTLGLDACSLLGMSWGATTAVAFAAHHPRRVRSLALVGGFARGEEIAPPALREALVATVRAHWGAGARALSDVWLPGADADLRDRFARLQRAAASAEVAAATLEAIYATDIRALAATVSAPALVVHRRDDHAIPHALGRELAASLQEARFVSLDGDLHLPWLGDSDAVLAVVDEFLARHDPPPATAPVAPRTAEPPPASPRAAPAPPRRRAAPRRRALARRRRRAARVSRAARPRRPRLRAPPAPRRPPPRRPSATASARCSLLVAEGLSDLEIAARLVVSPHTVHRHVANIRTKLGQPTRAAAAAYAARSGLI